MDTKKEVITTRTGRKLTLRFPSCLRARRFQSLLGVDVVQDGLKPGTVTALLDDKEKSERALAEMFEEQMTYEMLDENFSTEDFLTQVIAFFLKTRTVTLIVSNGRNSSGPTTAQEGLEQGRPKDSPSMQPSILLAEESQQ